IHEDQIHELRLHGFTQAPERLAAPHEDVVVLSEVPRSIVMEDGNPADDRVPGPAAVTLEDRFQDVLRVLVLMPERSFKVQSPVAGTSFVLPRADEHFESLWVHHKPVRLLQKRGGQSPLKTFADTELKTLSPTPDQMDGSVVWGTSLIGHVQGIARKRSEVGPASCQGISVGICAASDTFSFTLRQASEMSRN
ncbi:MAG: hypothetical protein ACE1Z6_11070, partial [Candidatus Methylomirabilales bacterium]